MIYDKYGEDIREQTKALRQGDMASSRRAYGDLCSSVDALALEFVVFSVTDIIISTCSRMTYPIALLLTLEK